MHTMTRRKRLDSYTQITQIWMKQIHAIYLRKGDTNTLKTTGMNKNIHLSSWDGKITLCFHTNGHKKLVINISWFLKNKATQLPLQVKCVNAINNAVASITMMRKHINPQHTTDPPQLFSCFFWSGNLPHSVSSAHQHLTSHTHAKLEVYQYF